MPNSKHIGCAMLCIMLTLTCAGRSYAQVSPTETKSTDISQQKRPNIVMLISDDDDHEHFGFMGSKIAQTPALDSLARSGTLFTTAHCPASLCRPSLASMLSGRLPHQHGIYANYLQVRRIGADKIKLDPTGSLPNRLKDAGYATYGTAKYWEGDPRAMGFTHGTVDVTFKGFGKFVRQDQKELFDFIDKQHKTKPMFIWWAPLLPHKPHNPPAKYADRFADTKIPIPSYVKGDPKKYVAAMRKFYAMGTWFDDGVAQLVQKLKDTGEYENTVFLFYVDNGYCFGMPAKNSPTEKGLRTPMFVTWPGHSNVVPEGKRIDQPSRAIDLHATALDYAGVEPAKGIASRSLRPQIEGAETENGDTGDTGDVVFGAVYAHAPAAYKGDTKRSAERDVYALYARTKEWKYILYTQDLTKQNARYIWMVHELSDAFIRKMGDENLFDMNADPYEEKDLASQAEQKERLAAFRGQVLDWWKRTGGGPLAVEKKLGKASGAKTSNRPNVIFVLTDDLGYSDIGCYGATKVKTPNIDRLAANGIRFTDFHTAASICSPSRAAFLTGAYPQRAGLYMGINPIRAAHWFLGLNPAEITLAEQFKQRDYNTFMVGKWHLGTEPEFHPLKQGFDHYYGMPCNFSHSPKFFDGEKEIFARTPLERLSELYTQRVTKIIRDSGDEPFFLYYAHNYPHTPFKAGKRFVGSSKDGVRGDVMQEMDWSIGEMMQALEDKGIAENTIVIFTSDNGPVKNEYAKPFRGTKYVTFEGGHRVPFIIHWPAMIKRSSVSDVPIHAMDLYPTLSQIIGADLPADRTYDGESLVPLIQGQPLKRKVEQPFFYYNSENLQAVRVGEWKLHLPRTLEQMPFWEKNKAFAKLTQPVLYNLRTDQAEQHDVAAEHPDVVIRIQAIATNARQELGEYMQRGSGQRPTGSVVEDAPVIGNDKDWRKVDAATQQRVQKERARRHGPVNPNKRSKKK